MGTKQKIPQLRVIANNWGASVTMNGTIFAKLILKEWKKKVMNSKS